ncbi:MAG: hypothetical protein KGI90_08345 [Burkholderiales bacterium]|nr:hypothetical protein [Burkholderiales bacterium]MDE2276247.1 hypothetical protein [Burkholderiales bacterium]
MKTTAQSTQQHTQQHALKARHLRRTLLAGVALAGLGLAAVQAWASDMPAAPPSASAGIVRERIDGHAFQTGGIGSDQVRAMQRRDGAYDLHLSFSEGSHNDYVTGLKVRVENPAGHPVFAYNDAGPLTDIRLPAGSYRVIADYHGVERSGLVQVKPGAPADLYLHWAKDLG